MAFWQTNTGFQVWIGTNPFSTWFNSGFSSIPTQNNQQSTTKTTKKKDDYTYNPRYPWFDEEDYKRLEKMVADKGLIGSAKTDAMDQLYQIYYPQVLNKHKLDERQQEINNSVYKNWEALLNWNKEVTMWTDLTKLAQEAKKKYNIPYNVNDQELVNDIVNGTENWNKLLYEYVNNWNPEIFYAAGIWDRPQSKTSQMWGTRDLINQASTSDKARWDKNLWEKWETVTNYTNLVWLWTEELDKKADEFANKWLNWGTKLTEWATENLKNKIENMSPEEVASYRKQYEQMLKDKDWRVGRVQWDTIVEQLWNGIKWDISYDYNDDDFMEWLIDQKTNLGEYLTWADDILKWESDPSIVQFFWNIPASALKTFTATVRWMTNPYDTLKWMVLLGKDVYDNWFKNSVIWQRYWSWDWLAKAMNEDPVWVADDALAATQIVWKTISAAWKVTGSTKLTNAGNYISSHAGSANDALAQKTVWGIYAWMDKLANLSDSSTVNKIVWWINRGLQDASSTEKLTQNIKEDLQPLRQKANERADNIIQNNNRMTKKQQENFKKMSWEDQWKWMNDRNIRTQEDLVDYFLESKKKVDDAMWKIEWQFTSKELTAVLDDSVDFAKKTENKDLGRLQELQTKNANGWLTMQEINEVKRFYEKNNKFNYLKEWTAEKSALATNRDTALREWQQKVATENGLTNLKELNKETQAAKFLADNATNWQSGIKGNNPISLTDWIVFAWDGINSNSLAWLVSKKIFTAPRFQDKLVDVLNYIGWHKTKWEINPNYQAIDMKNYEKRILAEELAKVKNQKDFEAWLEKAQYMAWPALPYNPQYNWNPVDYTTPTVVTPWGQSVRAWQIAEI